MADGLVASEDLKPMEPDSQLGRYLEVPVIADSVDSPIVQYGGDITAVHFPTQDGQWGRLTFERLDSIRVSRGEHDPFEASTGESDKYCWVSTITNSSWLRERYLYERKHYGKSYNFNGNVDEMLEEYSHYVFSFHDEFVEAIAAGIWFEVADSMLGNRELDPSHPLRGLRHLEISERFDCSGITGFLRRNPLSNEEIERGARLCSQMILEAGAELEGNTSPSWFLTHRIKDGVAKSFLRGYFGNAVKTYDYIPTLAEIRPILDQWLLEVRDRRRKMGKDK